MQLDSSLTLDLDCVPQLTLNATLTTIKVSVSLAIRVILLVAQTALCPQINNLQIQIAKPSAQMETAWRAILHSFLTMEDASLSILSAKTTIQLAVAQIVMLDTL